MLRFDIDRMPTTAEDGRFRLLFSGLEQHLAMGIFLRGHFIDELTSGGRRRLDFLRFHTIEMPSTASLVCSGGRSAQR